MGVRSDLFDFLVDLPASDSPDERKALVFATGFSRLGIYLDWQGSNSEFITRLLEEFGRRDEGTLTSFLEELGQTTQVGVDRKDKLVDLRSQVAELDNAGWRHEFGVAAAPGALTVDTKVLAVSVITDVLVPYYKLGADALRGEAGDEAAKLAEQVTAQVKAAFAGDRTAKKAFDRFKESPEDRYAALADILQGTLADDHDLTVKLADLMAAREKASSEGLDGLLKVSQNVKTVQGNVIGVIYGAAFKDKVARNIVINQTVETVGENGNLVGFSGGDWPPR